MRKLVIIFYLLIFLFVNNTCYAECAECTSKWVYYNLYILISSLVIAYFLYLLNYFLLLIFYKEKLNNDKIKKLKIKYLNIFIIVCLTLFFINTNG